MTFSADHPQPGAAPVTPTMRCRYNFGEQVTNTAWSAYCTATPAASSSSSSSSSSSVTVPVYDADQYNINVTPTLTKAETLKKVSYELVRIAQSDDIAAAEVMALYHRTVERRAQDAVLAQRTATSLQVGVPAVVTKNRMHQKKRMEASGGKGGRGGKAGGRAGRGGGSCKSQGQGQGQGQDSAVQNGDTGGPSKKKQKHQAQG